MKRRTRRGGVIIGQGSNAIVYTKPDPIERKLPKGCEWKDGYVMKVFDIEVSFKAKREWLLTGQLRQDKPEGMIYPESQCILNDGRYAIFSPKGGKSLFELFYSNDAIDTPEKLEYLFEKWETMKIVRNHEMIPKVIEALKVLKGQIEIMNKNIIHTDIYEGNVVYDGQIARLIDFGECRSNSQKTCRLDAGSIDNIIEKLEIKGGSRKLRQRVVKPKRRTQRRLSFLSK
jgi:serine/threonine protein kinase